MENEFYFNDKVSKSSDEITKMFNDLLNHLVSYMKIKKPLSLSSTLVGDEEIHLINKEYRHVDRPTDVISFAYNDEGSDENEPINDMGEIVISLDTAKKQAEFYKHPVERELAFLFIHGFLHLSGYDHVHSTKEAEVMFALQNDILNSFDYTYKEVI